MISERDFLFLRFILQAVVKFRKGGHKIGENPNQGDSASNDGEQPPFPKAEQKLQKFPSMPPHHLRAPGYRSAGRIFGMIEQNKIGQRIGKRFDDSGNYQEQHPQKNENRSENFHPKHFQEKSDGGISRKHPGKSERLFSDNVQKASEKSKRQNGLENRDQKGNGTPKQGIVVHGNPYDHTDRFVYEAHKAGEKPISAQGVPSRFADTPTRKIFKTVFRYPHFHSPIHIQNIHRMAHSCQGKN